jgi:transcriptional regulator with XRE-family HTH domain
MCRSLREAKTCGWILLASNHYSKDSSYLLPMTESESTKGKQSRQRGYIASPEGVKKLQEKRFSKGFSYEALANEAGLATDGVKRLFNPHWGRRVQLETIEKIARVLDLAPTDIINPDEWSSSNKELDVNIDNSNTIYPVFQSSIELKIGLSSETSRLISDVLKDFENITNAFLPKSFPQLNFTIIELGNEEARKKFQKPELYDIIMLDDPWIPAYLNNIEPLDSYLTEFGLNSKGLFGKVFLESFRSVCVHEDKIVAVPVLGNVQLLIHRCDVANKLSERTGSNLLDRELLHPNLRMMEDFYSIVQSTNSIDKNSYSAILSAEFLPLVVRDDGNGNQVVAFWEILRALGHKDGDRAVDDLVRIDLNTANQARSWLYDFTCRLNYSDIHSSLLARYSNIATALAWPGWITYPLSKNPLALSEIEFQRFSKAPVMGVWCLALPRYPAQLKLREYAVKVMLALTTDPNIQFFLAKRGNIPVLADFDEKVESLRQIPFWRRNYNSICAALADSLPRPRTKYWNDIERELELQIYRGEFRSIPGKLEF